MTTPTQRPEFPGRMDTSAATNVPRWSEPPPLPERLRTLVAVGIGPEGRAVAGRWAARARTAGCRVEHAALDQPDPLVEPDGLVAAARRIAATARVGTRVAVAGPEVDVLEFQGVLLDAAFLREEVLSFATSADVIRVRCVHCRTTLRARARPGGVVRCEACGYDLLVHHHVSRAHGAYLGFRADAESHA